MIHSPERAKDECEYIASLLRQVADAYAWTHSSGYQRSFNSDVKVSGAGVSDPTGSTVVSSYHTKVRDTLADASRHLTTAKHAALDALAALSTVLAEGDYAIHPDEEPFNGRLITGDEHKALLAQQKKRAQQGIRPGEG